MVSVPCLTSLAGDRGRNAAYLHALDRGDVLDGLAVRRGVLGLFLAQMQEHPAELLVERVERVDQRGEQRRDESS